MILSKERKFLEQLERANNVAIYTHINVDGDGIGSAFALFYLLKNMGKHPFVFVDSELPTEVQYLNIKALINIGDPEMCDLHIAVDSNSPQRLGKYQTYFENAKNTMMTDHHSGTDNYARINIVNSKMASNTELLFWVFRDRIRFSKRTAESLLLGILTDTGGLRFRSTTHRTLEAVSILCKEYGANFAELMANIFEKQPHDYFLAHKYAYEHTEFYDQNRIVLITVPNSFYVENGVDVNMSKGLSRIGTELKDTKFLAVINEEVPGKFRIAVRTRDRYDAGEIARRFGGGGHKQAAGLKLFGDIETVKEKLLKAFRDEL